MEKKIKLGKRTIGHGEPCFVICEGGVTNYGQVKLAKKQIRAAVDAQADIFKFQACVTEKLVSKKVSRRLEKELGYNWFDRMKYKEFPFKKVKELIEYARSLGIPAFATAHDDESLDFLDNKMNQPYFKVGSGEAHNYEFLKNIAKRKKPVIISFGVQTNKEVDRAISTLRRNGVKDIIILHCVSVYPTPYEHANLKRMEYFRDRYNVPVGISDHSVGWHVPLAAVASGACVVEKHLTFDKTDPRSLDNPGALLPQEFKLMVKQIRDIENALRQHTEEERIKALEKGRNWAGQSIVAAKDLPIGTVLTKNMFEFKRPGKGGLPPVMVDEIVGRKVKKMIEADEQIMLDDLG